MLTSTKRPLSTSNLSNSKGSSPKKDEGFVVYVFRTIKEAVASTFQFVKKFMWITSTGTYHLI